MNVLKAVNKRRLTIFSTFLFSVALIISVFVGAYYFFMGESYTLYEKNIYDLMASIDTANGSTEAFIKNKTIDPELVKK